jgi:hypothetical protein
MEVTKFREIAPAITSKDNDVRVVARELCIDMMSTMSLCTSHNSSATSQEAYVDDSMILSSNVRRVRRSTQDEMPFHRANDRLG